MTPAREHWSHLWRARGLGDAVKRGVARPFGGQVPAGLVWALRRPLRGEDPLVTPPSKAGPEAIADPFLRERLTGRELGMWTLSAHAIDYVVDAARERRPVLAVEFSSGVSTLVLAHALRASGAALEAPWVISVEQDAEHAAATRAMLAAAGLAEAAQVLHAPLVRRPYDGAERPSYDLDGDVLASHIGGRAVGIALVDGPAAEAGARVTTVPMLCPHLSAPCPLLLDDALRDGELYAARSWQRSGMLERPRYDMREGGLLHATLLQCP